MEKKKHTRRNITLATAAALIGYISMGWSFFYFMTVAKEKNVGKKADKKFQRANQKKWYALNHTTVNHPRYGYEEEYQRSREWCEAQSMQDMYIHSKDGLKLHASYLPAEKAERIVIMCHGYRGTKFGSVAHMAEFLHENNCDLLFIDQRCCGESEGKIITFGAKEHDDIIRWIDAVEEKNEKDLPVYLYGQSMGATSVLLASGRGLPENVRGLIADCGFHSMKQQLADIAKEWFDMHRVGLLLYRVDVFCKLLGKFSMKQTDTTKALEKNRIPVLFFHGKRDTYVFPENSRTNYKLCRADKELVMVPKARHLCCSFVAPELYKEKLYGFFRKYDKPSA